MKITEAALAKITEFLTSESEDKVFRVRVESGGCSGFQYKTEITGLQDGDIQLAVKVVTDPISQTMLQNTQLDYQDTIGQSGFVFSNPDAKSTCGCGISFDF